jgi:hypothetical protein
VAHCHYILTQWLLPFEIVNQSQMLLLLEHDGGRMAINPDRFDKLITALRTAVDNDGVLDKEATSYNDIFDAFRLSLKFYHFREVE